MSTKTWERLEAGKAYNSRQNPPYNDLVDTNNAFFNGEQWPNMKTDSDLPRPVFDIIRRSITFLLGWLTSSPIDIQYEQLAAKNKNSLTRVDIDLLNAEMDNFIERCKLNSMVRDAYKDGAVSGDYAFHMIFDPNIKPYDGAYSDAEGEVTIELVDGCNVYFGNPNNHKVQPQPYIIITGRDMIENLQAEYDEMNKEENELKSDNDTEFQAGYEGRIEIDDTDGTGKATYAYMYEKKRVKVKSVNELGEEVTNTETRVFVTKSIKDVDIYKDVDTGLTYYPIAFNNWERKKNTYHGLAMCTRIIPSQIFINRMFAMIMKSLQDTAFPKAIYDKNRIAGWSNQVSSAIGVDLSPGENIGNIARYLEPAAASPQIIQVIELAWQFTKESIGMTDALMGAVNPEQASGAAISVSAKQAATPLTIPRDNMYDTLEDIGRIFLDMVKTYYGQRPVLMPDNEGNMGVFAYDFSNLKKGYLTTKVNVGATTPYDKLADRMTMENFVKEGLVTFSELLSAYPDMFPNAEEVLARVKAQEAQAQIQPPMEQPL